MVQDYVLLDNTVALIDGPPPSEKIAQFRLSPFFVFSSQSSWCLRNGIPYSDDLLYESGYTQMLRDSAYTSGAKAHQLSILNTKLKLRSTWRNVYQLSGKQQQILADGRVAVVANSTRWAMTM